MTRLSTAASTAAVAAALVLVSARWPRAAHAEPDEPNDGAIDAGVDASVDDAARADDEPPPVPPAPVRDPGPVAPPPVIAPPPPPFVPPPRFPQHFLFGNGLSLLITRLSVGYEYLPVAHHSVGFSIYGQYGGGIITELLGMKGAFAGVGGELGYRFYAWRDGPFGPFIGFSFISGVYHTQATFYRIDPNSYRYAQYGPAFDFGWSAHLDRTTVLAVSLGAQYTFTSVDAHGLNEVTRLLVGDGPRPRGGIQVGKTF